MIGPKIVKSMKLCFFISPKSSFRLLPSQFQIIHKDFSRHRQVPMLCMLIEISISINKYKLIDSEHAISRRYILNNNRYFICKQMFCPATLYRVWR